MMGTLEKVKYYICSIVGISAATVTGAMIVLAFSQLIARWVFNSSISGADLMLRQMVLIIGLLGGVLAAATNRHIRIDLVDNFIKGKWKARIRGFVNLTAAGVAGYLGWTSISFVQSERQAEVVLRGLLFGNNVAQWYIEILIPICFLLMAFLFMTSVFLTSTPRDNTGYNT